MENVLVSQFELVFKPQSPAPPADTVLQGYFLEITNLEATQLQFALTFTTSSISDANRRLLDNAVVFVDTPSTNNNDGVFRITGSRLGQVFQLNRRIVVPARGTALVALIPSDPFSSPLGPDTAPNFECRGYVTISLPAFTAGGRPGQVVFAPQAEGNQKVLLTAQNRAVYTDPETGQPKGQTQSSVPLASGQSLTEITPRRFGFNDPFDLEVDRDDEVFAGVDPDRFGLTLASLMLAAEQSGIDMDTFNAKLEDAGGKMKLATAK